MGLTGISGCRNEGQQDRENCAGENVQLLYAATTASCINDVPCNLWDECNLKNDQMYTFDTKSTH